MVVCQSDRVEVLEDFFRGVIFLDLALEVKTYHVAGVELRSELEEFKEALSLCLLQILGAHTDDKVNVKVVVVLFVVLHTAKKPSV